MNTTFSGLKNHSTKARLQKENGVMGRSVYIFLLLCQLPYAIFVRAQNLPNFTAVNGTQLTNTNGEWVRINPTQPNNIDLLESRIFTMPAAEQGILKVEFKLVGGDGGTAHYNGGAYNNFANGGRGGEVNFTLELKSTNTYGKPFMVTFGKKGESNMFGWGMYVSAGGGGSTGMSWLEPGMYNKDLNKKWGVGSGKLIAAAGGGSGGFATGYESVHGKNATRSAAGTNGSFADLDLYQGLYLGDAITISGGSGLYNDDSKPASCCTNELKSRQSSSIVYHVSEYRTGLSLGGSNLFLTALTHGQGGGKSTTLYDAQQGSSYVNNALGFGANAIQYPVIKPGGKGGSGMAGGGAGSATVGYFDAWIISFSNKKYDIPTSGAGGTGTIAAVSRPQRNLQPGDDGYNDYSSLLKNATISNRSSTNSPQSGYLMYRTVQDIEAPTIVNHQLTISIGPGNHTLTLADVQQHISDNDGIKTISFSPAQLTCSDVGNTVVVAVSATDFIGNSISSPMLITVKANSNPFAVLPEVSPYLTQPNFPRQINITNANYTLTAANFPPGVKGCTGSDGITLHFPPTTFNCSSVGNQSVDYYYTDAEGNSSPVYTKIFIVSFSGATTGRLYVDQAATGVNDGSSWADAFTSLQDAFKCAGPEGREVYVAKGTYRPDRGVGMMANDRNASFVIPENFKVYGGFPNGGGDFDKRNHLVNPTLLSGEIGSGNNNDNSLHIVSLSGSTILDGFTIQDGFASGDITDGGGALKINQTGTLITDSRITINNCKFLNNYGDNGGAVYASFSNRATINYLDFKNCLFENNLSGLFGGAVNYASVSNLQQTFNNCAFNNNRAGIGNGGALMLQSDTQTNITNSTFAYNSAPMGVGGAIYNYNGNVTMHNSIIYYNTTKSSAGNQIVNNVPETIKIAYSNIEGSGGSGNWSSEFNSLGIKDLGNNIDADPLFHTHPALSLLPQSPSRNTGSNAYNHELYDIANNARVSRGAIDMGAYELSEVLYVAADAPAGRDGNTWASAMNNLNSAITEAAITQKDIWVKEGTYVPDRIPGSNTVTPNNRENSFSIGNLAMYGGFAGTEASIAQRNIGQHPTILNGDLGIRTLPGDNAYHVVKAAGNARLDGLIIENGYAGGSGEHAKGAGVYQVVSAGDTNTVVSHVTFRDNIALANGGAWYTAADNPGKTDFVQSLFYANRAARGAAVFLASNLVDTDTYGHNFYNITAFGNTAQGTVTGAFEAEQSATTAPAKINAYNSIWSGNLPANYSDITNPGHITLTNTYTGTATGVFTDVYNATGADGKIMTADDGLQLNSSSPAISYGDNALAYPGIDKDIAGKQRITGTLDAGAYESEYTAPLIADANGVIYVKPNAIGNGTNWNNATGDLHNAIQANGVHKVFVAKGNYPVGDNSFIMKNGVAIYGGFDPENGITDLSHNRIMPDAAAVQGSILDGQNMRPVIWNVFTASSPMDNTAVLDGFTITKGTYHNGAGMRNVYASPTLNNLFIFRNAASVSGGGIYNDNSSPLLTNAVVSNNFIINATLNTTISGAGVANVASSAPKLTNVTITANNLIAPLGTAKGAGIYSNNSSPEIYNSIIWNNQIMNNPTLADADLKKEGSGTLKLKNSITQSYTTGNGADNNKANVNPLFVSEQYADYGLQAVSQGIDAGNSNLYTGLDANTKDLAGNQRVYEFSNNGKVDIGAYEYQCVPVDFSKVILEDVMVGYDGNPHGITAQNLPQAATVIYEIKNAANQTAAGNTATQAGVYTITATLSVAGACAPQIRTATLTIAKALAIITANATQTFTYDGTVKNITPNLDHTEATLTYYPQQGYTEAGGYWITVSAPETDNYLPVSENIALVIENADLTGITLNDASFTRDGTPKSLAISGTVPTDAIVVYNGNERADIGTYNVNALIQKTNYNDLWLTAVMTITEPLPVKLISFTARKQERAVLLEWATATEYNNQGFEIEVSANGRNWGKIGFVPGVSPSGNSTVNRAYRFIDETPLSGTNYYRLKQLDYDGRYEYSHIQVVTFHVAAGIKAYPNPVSNHVTIELPVDYTGSKVRLFSVSGVELQQFVIDRPTFKIVLDKYPAGIYLLLTFDGRVIKLVKD